MLTFKKNKFTALKRIISLLFIISSFTFLFTDKANSDTSTAEEYRQLGYAEHQKGNLNGALSYYTKAVELGLRNAVVHNDMGVLYEQINLPVKAENHYLTAIEADPDFLPPYMNLGYLYLNRGRKDRAFKFLRYRYEKAQPGDVWADRAREELLKIHPEYADVALQIDAKRLNREMEIRAQEEFQKIVMQTKDFLEKGDTFAQKGEYAEAIYYYDKALSLSPHNRKALEARKQATIDMAKQNVKEHSDMAIQLLNAGDSISAKREVQKILTSIPSEPIISK